MTLPLDINLVRIVYDYCTMVSDEDIQVTIQASLNGTISRTFTRTGLDVACYINNLAVQERGLYARALALELVTLSGYASEKASSFTLLPIHSKVALVAFQSWSYFKNQQVSFTPIFVLREWTNKPADMPKEETLDPAMKIPFWYGNYVTQKSPYKKDEVLKKSEITWGELRKILGQSQKLDARYDFLPEPVQAVKYIESPKDEGKKSS